MVLVFAMLVLPGYAALLARCRIRQAFVWTIILPVLIGIVGLTLSFRWENIPASTITIISLGATVLFCAVIGMWKARRAVH